MIYPAVPPANKALSTEARMRFGMPETTHVHIEVCSLTYSIAKKSDKQRYDNDASQVMECQVAQQKQV